MSGSATDCHRFLRLMDRFAPDPRTLYYVD